MMNPLSYGKHFNTWFEHRFTGLLEHYDHYVRKALESPMKSLLILLGIFILSLIIIPFIGVSYFPQTNSGQFLINIKAPTGTRIEVTEQEVTKVEDIIRKIVDKNDLNIIVSNMGVTPDFSAMYTSNTASNTAFTQVSLKEGHKKSTAYYIEQISQEIQSELPQLRTYFQSGGLVDATINQGLPAPIDIQVSGFDLNKVYEIALSIASKVNALDSVREVYIPQDIDAPSLNLEIDRQHASELGLSQQDVMNNIITSLTSNQMIAPNYWIDPKSGNDYMLTVQYPEETVKTLEDLKSIPIRSSKRTLPIHLDVVADIKPFLSPTVVTHYQLQRVIDVYVAPKREDLGLISKQINHILKQTKLPEDVRIDIRGSVEAMHASFESFGIGLLLAVLLVYLVLVAQFKSFIDPFLILLAVLPGLSGAFLILFFTHTTFNIISLMGILMMVGITVSNSILIVDFTKRLRGERLNLNDAVVTACKVRLRPILMTSLATIFGLLPLSLGLSTGSEIYAPLARVIIGGLTVSVIVTVFLVPVAYKLIYNRQAPRI